MLVRRVELPALRDSEGNVTSYERLLEESELANRSAAEVYETSLETYDKEPRHGIVVVLLPHQVVGNFAVLNKAASCRVFVGFSTKTVTPTAAL